SVFDWTRKLDVPRWQEILANCVQLGAHVSVQIALENTLESVNTVVTIKPLRGSSALLADSQQIYSEANAAERVSLAARVMRDMPISPERTTLQTKLRAAVRHIVEHGIPVAQSKVLETIQRTPEIASFDVIEPALRSELAWIRDQAHIVAAAISAP